ncbi:MAG TPA: RNA-binding protein, partial [Bacteroidales bacterium]|nr:RNA-binding protein [Bacteroidales bacterium]
CRIAYSGGQAHDMVEQGIVKVNDITETRKRAKIRPGDKVQIGTEIIAVKPKK